MASTNDYADDMVKHLARGPLTIAELVEKTGRSDSSVRKLCRALVASGKLAETGDGPRGSVRFGLKQDYDSEDVVMPGAEKERRARAAKAPRSARARDEAIFEALKTGPLDIHQLEEKVGATNSKTYLSLHRLMDQKRVRKQRTTTRTPVYVTS
jgi:DNA-binding IclR family transcriptional regulator